MTIIADIPRARTETHWDRLRERMNDTISPAPSAAEESLEAFEKATSTGLNWLLIILGTAVAAMAMHHLATFGIPFGGRGL